MKYPSFCLNKKTKGILPCGREKTIKTWLKGAGGMLRAKVWLPAAVCKDDALNGRIMGAEFDPVSPPETLKVMMHSLGRNYIMDFDTGLASGNVSKKTRLRLRMFYLF